MDIRRRIGGLPTWAWGVGIGGGLILGLYMRSRKRVESASVSTETPAPVPVGATGAYEGMIAEGVGLPGSPGFVGATGNFEGQFSREIETARKEFREELENSRGILKAEVESTLRQSQEELRNAQRVMHESGETTSPIQVIVGTQPAPSPPQGGGPPVTTVRPPRPPATPPGPVIRNGVDIAVLEAALRYANDPRYRFPNHRRETLADLIRAHPDWGPMTIANCGQVRGHSTRA